MNRNRFGRILLTCSLAMLSERLVTSAVSQELPEKPEFKVGRNGALTFTECVDPNGMDPQTWTFSVPGKIYHLALAKSQLDHFHVHRDDQVAVSGTPVLAESGAVQEYTIDVRAIKLLHRPKVVPASDTDTSRWLLFRKSEFGISMRYPTPESHARSSLSPEFFGESSKPNFISPKGSRQLFRFSLGSMFPNALAGGELSVWVNPRIDGLRACQQFANSDPGSESFRSLGPVRYAESDNGGILGRGRWVDDDYLHVYRNGLCYEFHFAVEGSNRGNPDNQCAYNDPDISEAKELVMDLVSFFKPGE